MSESPVRILIVDDDEMMRTTCRRFLARFDDLELVVEEAASGEDAIEMLRDRMFDCVLSDYRMGAVSGIDVLAFAMKTRPKAVRILFTGFAATQIQQEALVRANVHEFLEKPMTTRELESLLTASMIDQYVRPLARKKIEDAWVAR